MRPGRSSGEVSFFGARAMLRGYGCGQRGGSLGSVAGPAVVGDHRPPGVAASMPLPAVTPQEQVDEAAEARVGLPHVTHTDRLICPPGCVRVNLRRRVAPRRFGWRPTELPPRR